LRAEGESLGFGAEVGAWRLRAEVGSWVWRFRDWELGMKAGGLRRMLVCRGRGWEFETKVGLMGGG